MSEKLLTWGYMLVGAAISYVIAAPFIGGFDAVKLAESVTVAAVWGGLGLYLAPSTQK